MPAHVRLEAVAFALLLLVGVGCTEEPSPMAHRALSDSIEAGYERLQQAYASADTLPPALRRMRGAMGQMHGQMRRPRRGMGGNMHEGGMHDERQGRRDGHGQLNMHDEGARRGGSGRDSTEMWEWHQQMMSMHARMARMHDGGGLARRHRRMERRHRRMMKTFPSKEPADPSETQQQVPAGDAALAAQGEDLYAQHCASCHGRKGNGLGGAFPPLAGTNWVTGEADTAIRIVLHGLRGRISVKDRIYNNVMPAFGRRLSDDEVAAILSYVRTSWGNGQDRIESEKVRETRARYSDRVQPWTASQLRTEE